MAIAGLDLAQLIELALIHLRVLIIYLSQQHLRQSRKIGDVDTIVVNQYQPPIGPHHHVDACQVSMCNMGLM